MSSFKFIDLFAGIGGTRHAFEKEGGKCVFTCEIEEEAREVYEANWNDVVDENDIRDVESGLVPDHDILLACWPCPSFSIFGKRSGLEDERGNLFFETIDILDEKQPDAFLMENVKNLEYVNDGEAFDRVRMELGHGVDELDEAQRILDGELADFADDIEGAGYDIHWEVLNALDFGLPQHRERMIIVGFREERPNFSIPREIPKETLRTEEKQRQVLADLIEHDRDEAYVASEKIRADRRAAVEDPDSIPSPSIWHENRHSNISTKPYSGTLRATSSWNYILIDGKYLPTPRERLRLQGFPESFSLDGFNRSQVRRLTGNTVPIPMIHQTAKAMVAELGY